MKRYDLARRYAAQGWNAYKGIRLDFTSVDFKADEITSGDAFLDFLHLRSCWNIIPGRRRNSTETKRMTRRHFYVFVIDLHVRKYDASLLELTLHVFVFPSFSPNRTWPTRLITSTTLCVCRALL